MEATPFGPGHSDDTHHHVAEVVIVVEVRALALVFLNPLRLTDIPEPALWLTPDGLVFGVAGTPVKIWLINAVLVRREAGRPVRAERVGLARDRTCGHLRLAFVG
jgi:hypothetical protein